MKDSTKPIKLKGIISNQNTHSKIFFSCWKWRHISLVFYLSCSRIQNNNHLDRNWTPNHLARLAWMIEQCCKYLSVWSIDSVFLSCDIRIHSKSTPYFKECREIPCSKQVRYVKINWLQGDSSPQPLSL